MSDASAALSGDFDHESLRAFRVARDYSQEEFARRIGYSAVHYNRIERGWTEISDKFRRDAVRAFPPYAESEDRMRWAAEEYDAAMLVLDDHGVPRATAVAELSLVGRIMRYGEMRAADPEKQS